MFEWQCVKQGVNGMWTMFLEMQGEVFGLVRAVLVYVMYYDF